MQAIFLQRIPKNQQGVLSQAYKMIAGVYTALDYYNYPSSKFIFAI